MQPLVGEVDAQLLEVIHLQRPGDAASGQYKAGRKQRVRTTEWRDARREAVGTWTVTRCAWFAMKMIKAGGGTWKMEALERD